MSHHPTIYLNDEEYQHLNSKDNSLSGAIRELVQQDMAEEAVADA